MIIRIFVPRAYVRISSRYAWAIPSRVLPGTVCTCLVLAESSDFSQAARALNGFGLRFPRFLAALPGVAILIVSP